MSAFDLGAERRFWLARGLALPSLRPALGFFAQWALRFFAQWALRFFAPWALRFFAPWALGFGAPWAASIPLVVAYALTRGEPRRGAPSL